MSDPQNRPDDEEGDAGKEEDRRRLVVIRRHLVNAHDRCRCAGGIKEPLQRRKRPLRNPYENPTHCFGEN